MKEAKKVTGLPEMLGRAAREGARMTGQNGKNCGRLCKDCAFKPNQPHTAEYLEAVEAAAFCLAGDGSRFTCHEDGGGESNGLPCMGYWYAKQYLDSKETDTE